MSEETKYKIKGVDIEAKSTYYYSTPEYVPNEKQQTVITNTWQRFTEIRNNRDLTHRWFGKRRDGTYRNLIDYINVCEKRWNSDGIPRTNLEEWQASVFKPETRNKIIAILSAVAQQRPGMKFKGVEKSDFLREQILDDLYTWSQNKDNGDEMAIYTMLDALIHGTAVRYVGYEDCKRVIRELEPGEDGYDIYNLKSKEKIIVEKKITTKEVRLQDFYFGSMMTRRMDEQPDCAWRKLMRLKDFKKEFGGWKDSKYVLPGGDLTDETHFASLTSEEVREKDSELVEVIRYYNKESDQFVILANGVWVNPLGSDVCPLPFSHKELPFFTILFEPLSSDFPYGKAAPDKYLNEQDAINALYNMMLDQVYVSIHKPLVTGDEDALDDVEVVPGKINYIGADVANIQELQISPPSPAAFSMLNILHQSLQESSVDATQQGQGGEDKTATATRIAASAAARTFNLFLQFVYHGYKRQAKLTVSNFLQFMTLPDVEKVLGSTEDYQEAFAAFKLDTQMLNGKAGTRIIELVDQETLEQKYASRLQEREELEPQNIEKVYITPEFIRNFEYHVEPIPDSTVKETPETEQALFDLFVEKAMTYFPDMTNREALYEEFLRVYRKQDKDIKLPNAMRMGQLPMGQPTGQGNNIGQQIIGQATGNQATGGINLNQLGSR